MESGYPVEVPLGLVRRYLAAVEAVGQGSQEAGDVRNRVVFGYPSLGGDLGPEEPGFHQG